MKEVIEKLEEAKMLAEQSQKLSVGNKINALIYEMEL